MKKILVVGPSWVGDMVMAQSLFKLLRQQDADAVIDVLAPGWSQPILACMPEVNKSIDMPLGHGKLGLGRRRQLGKSLQSSHYQHAFVLPNSFKSALVPFSAKIPVRSGWRGEMRYGLLNDMRLLNEKRYPLMVQRFAALALPDKAALPESLPWPKLVIDEQRRQLAIDKFGLSVQERPVLALCPGAEFGSAKCWPAQYYGELADTKIKEGWQVWIIGSEKDRPIAEKVKATISSSVQDNATLLAGDTSLQEAVDLLSLASSVVSNDSGLMHVAAALDRPVVAIYGSTSPDFAPPLSDKAKIVYLDLACSPCAERECPLKHHQCMRNVLPSHVGEFVGL